MNEMNNENILGYYSLSNNNTLLIHAFDNVEDKVLVSLNGNHMKWCDIKIAPIEDGSLDSGFYFWGEDDTFIPFSEVISTGTYLRPYEHSYKH